VSKQQKKTHKLASAPQQIKILAGRWRGTKLPVLLEDDLRPTPSRVRETLFNWLQPYIVGSQCLDLFAGSGALSFEAVSRGANSAILVDKDPRVVQLLSQQLNKLQAEEIQVVCDDGLHYLQQLEQAFDIIFLDPPFSKLHPLDLLTQIDNKQLLKPNGVVYAEFSAKNRPESVPEGWRWQRQSKAGEVEYGLLISE